MKHIVLTTLLTATCMLAHAAGAVVITHPGTQLQASDVNEVFLGNKQFVGSVKLVPVDNAQTQAAFLSDVLKIDANKYHHVWARKAFQDGVAPPPVKGTDAEVLEYVKRTPGAVGYVSTDPGKGAVNVVGK
ncbi:MAG: phosphate ABC transporter substrate-binding protein [Burkholderiales bacterium]|nr:MAG: phosphate ABC transporter substrate-binding protein [Burkholderiales bacterium]